ncbi:tRNA adenosine(34) deaminase TadA [Helicobacter pylori]
MMALTTPPLAPKVVAALAGLQIYTVEDVQAACPCRVFLLLKKSGLSVTLSVFWQLVALSLQKHVSDLSDGERAAWQKKLQEMPPVAVFPSLEEQRGFMQAALVQAALAAEAGEVPVGAVVVHRGKIVAQAYNRCVADCNVSHHAEILALAQAGQVLGSYRLNECDVYVSLEPCAMCAGALIQARVARVIFAASEPKTGAAGSVVNLFANKTLNAHTAMSGGVLADEAQVILQQFFQKKRDK